MSENTKIVQCFLPAMVAGKYTTEVSQRVIKDKVSIQDIKKTFDFGVDAARFTLNPNDIYSVYPPANKSETIRNHCPIWYLPGGHCHGSVLWTESFRFSNGHQPWKTSVIHRNHHRFPGWHYCFLTRKK